MHDFLQSFGVRRIRATWEMTTLAFTRWSQSGGHRLFEAFHIRDQCFQIIGRQIDQRHASGRHLSGWVLK
jgi:hypothetical protein